MDFFPMNRQPVLSEMTLGDLISRNARYRGKETALVFEGRRYTHEQFCQRVFRLANGLITKGIKRQERIAVLAPNCSEYLEAFGAGEVAGFIVVNLNIRLSEAELIEICRDCEPATLIYDEQFAGVTDALCAAVPGIRHTLAIGASGSDNSEYEQLLASASDLEPPLRAQPTDTAYLIYTSGSTGRPKGVMWSHAAMLEAARIVSHDGGLQVDDVSLCVMPLFHVGAKIEQLGVSLLGGTTVLHRNFDVDAVLETIAAEKISAALLAPIMIQRIVDNPRVGSYDMSRLRCVHYASAPMPTPVLKRALELFGPIFIQMYGMTECQGLTLLKKHQHRPDGNSDDIRRLSSVGQAAFGCAVKIVAPNGAEAGPHVLGEICLGTFAVMQGYWNNHAATIATLRDGWMHTGDVGYLDDEDFLFIVDRKKDMIISGGENIYSWEVEEAIRTHDSVAEVAVIAVPDANWGEAVKACVVLKHGASTTAQELIDHCRTKIASYKKPKTIDFMQELPRLAPGKVDKKALRSPYWASMDKQVS
jgi:acyl-CoA synthetase (AMP-forming)/AMP-acid ligase II